MRSRAEPHLTEACLSTVDMSQHTDLMQRAHPRRLMLPSYTYPSPKSSFHASNMWLRPYIDVVDAMLVGQHYRGDILDASLTVWPASKGHVVGVEHTPFMTGSGWCIM